MRANGQNGLQIQICSPYKAGEPYGTVPLCVAEKPLQKGAEEKGTQLFLLLIRTFNLLGSGGASSGQTAKGQRDRMTGPWEHGRIFCPKAAALDISTGIQAGNRLAVGIEYMGSRITA